MSVETAPPSPAMEVQGWQSPRISLSYTLTATATSPPKSCSSPSPEFEFWMVRNPNFPAARVLPADQLFFDGVVLPLRCLQQTDSPPPEPDFDDEEEAVEKEEDPQVSFGKEVNFTTEMGLVSEKASASILSGDASAAPTISKRWRDIFKVGEKKPKSKSKMVESEERTKKERKKMNSELNINIWPFSRSRSAGGSGNSIATAKPRVSISRKASSAPCSRSNSTGETKSKITPADESGRISSSAAGFSKGGRRCASSSGKPSAGIYIGRSSPVRPVRRPSTAKKPERSPILTEKIIGCGVGGGGGVIGGGSGRVKVLNVNVPLCMGYGPHLRCSVPEQSAAPAAGNSGVGGNNGLFRLRDLFSKRIH